MDNPEKAKPKDIIDLRETVFDTIEKLKKGEIELDRAQGVAKLATVLVNTAKVELAMIKEIGGVGSGFVPLPEEFKNPLGKNNQKKIESK